MKVSDGETGSELKALATKTLVVASILILCWLTWQLRELLMLVFGAVLVSVVLRMIARPVHHRFGIGEGWALGVAVLLLFGILAIAMWLFGAEVAKQTSNLVELIPKAWASLQGRLEQWGLAGQVEKLTQGGTSSGFLSNVSGLVMSVGGGLTDLLLVIFGGIYIAAQPGLYRKGLLKLIPAGRRPLIGDALDDSGRALQLWLKGRLVSMTFVAILTGIGLAIIGVPSALTLALLAGLLEFIPFVGPILSAVPAVLLALASSPTSAFWVALLFLLIQQLEGNVIEPLVQQRAVELPPALLLFAIVAATLIFGTIGILLGAPLLVVLYVLVKRLYVREVLDTETPIPGEDPA
jgi:predicted PurR-regulated permease PerM